MSVDLRVVFLGAGRPSRGYFPSALKPITLRQRALDWQITAFEVCRNPRELVYVGGYEFESVVRAYPQLRFLVVQDWSERGVVHTMLHAPRDANRVVYTYSDTVFQRDAISAILKVDADVVFGYDSKWRDRYVGRTKDDIAIAERICVQTERGLVDAEFTGLVAFGASALGRLDEVNEAQIKLSMPELIAWLSSTGLRVEGVDLSGQWAEFNAPEDIARFILGSKADTLARLAPLVSRSRIGELVSFTLTEWQSSRSSIIYRIQEVFGGKTIIVRSSCVAEDGWTTSSAGRFESIADVGADDVRKVAEAVDRVVASYATLASSADQVFVQEQLSDVQMAGVALTCGLDNGAPYYSLNVDQESRSTNVVTAGGPGQTRSIFIAREEPERLAEIDPALKPVLDAVREIETILVYDKLDIEFAIDAGGVVHIFQVRPITVDHSDFEYAPKEIQMRRRADIECFRAASVRNPWVVGRRTVFGDMPDWNPAEILGARPKPFALSLYQYLITDEVWASQRAGFGYRDIRPHPLLQVFSGRPYVDVRASLNSFVPAILDNEVAERFVEAGIERLVANPHLHDKIEFEVMFTVWDPAFRKRACERFFDTPITALDVDKLEEALKGITRGAISRLDADLAPIRSLYPRREEILTSNLGPLHQARALIEDCKRFGTPVFANAARAGFVAVTLLDGLVATGGLSPDRRQAFLRGLDTVARQLRFDRAGEMSLVDLVGKYGHLRPGTYDLTAEAYHENPERYLGGNVSTEPADPFVATSAEKAAIGAMIVELGLEVEPEDLLAYLKAACEAREATKFEFTKNLSLALDRIVLGLADFDIDRESAAYLRYEDVLAVCSGAVGKPLLKSAVRIAQEEHRYTRISELPSLIVNEADFSGFEHRRILPNFVTFERASGRVHQVDHGTPPPDAIILAPQADPGYDWLFDCRIAGLVTRYGGSNSHMAIRAAELGLPAAIGVGDIIYDRIATMREIELDCANRTIRELL